MVSTIGSFDYYQYSCNNLVHYHKRIVKLKKVILFLLIAVLSGCVQVGEFTPKRHAQHEEGHVDCEKMPDRCINGVAW